MKLEQLCACCLAGSIAGSALANEIVIVNQLPTASSCPNGNTVTVFYDTGQQQTIQPGSSSTPIEGDFSQLPGLGVQVNNWYWIQTSAPPQKSPQNPDNSGAQFVISSECVLTDQTSAWSGKGIQTYLIANVSAALEYGKCKLTVSANSYTNAVTPNCCAPPVFSGNVCTGPWGKTNTGQAWPPK